MKKLTEKAIVATGIEMTEAKLFSENHDDTLILWIKYNWNVSSKTDVFAPISDIFHEKNKNSTHKIKGEEMYLTLPKDDDGHYLFEAFINRFIEIEQL